VGETTICEELQEYACIPLKLVYRYAQIVVVDGSRGVDEVASVEHRGRAPNKADAKIKIGRVCNSSHQGSHR
jgi:hypothetical protein